MSKISKGQFDHIADDMFWSKSDRTLFKDILQHHLKRLGINVVGRKFKGTRQARHEAWIRFQKERNNG